MLEQAYLRTKSYFNRLAGNEVTADALERQAILTGMKKLIDDGAARNDRGQLKSLARNFHSSAGFVLEPGDITEMEKLAESRGIKFYSHEQSNDRWDGMAADSTTLKCHVIGNAW